MEQQQQGERKPRNKDGRRPKTRRKNGYIHRSPAVHVTVYDLTGRPMPQADADEIVQAVFDIAMQKGYVINFART